MASLVLLFSELVRNRKCGAAALLAAYPSSSSSSSSSSYSTITSSSYAAAVRKPLKDDENTMQNLNNRIIEEIQERVTENHPLESRVCVDFVWP
ncbi:hypothetical protein Lal_00042214 [Lupinus albus]|nr:hypothetical protein Lal_00042214 [Lupinus albus]